MSLCLQGMVDEIVQQRKVMREVCLYSSCINVKLSILRLQGMIELIYFKISLMILLSPRRRLRCQNQRNRHLLHQPKNNLHQQLRKILRKKRKKTHSRLMKYVQFGSFSTEQLNDGGQPAMVICCTIIVKP